MQVRGLRRPGSDGEGPLDELDELFLDPGIGETAVDEVIGAAADPDFRLGQNADSVVGERLAQVLQGMRTAGAPGG